MTNEEYDLKIAKLEATNTDLVTSIGKLEKANADLVTERVEFKQKLKDGVTDEELKAENEKLMAVLESQDQKFSEQATTHTAEVNRMKIISMFDATGIKADSDKAKELLIPLLQQGSDFAEDGFRYVDEEKTTEFKADNVKYDLMDRINDLRDNGYGGLFQPAKGGGMQSKDTGSPSTNYKDMSAQDKVDYFNTNGTFPQG